MRGGESGGKAKDTLNGGNGPDTFVFKINATTGSRESAASVNGFQNGNDKLGFDTSGVAAYDTPAKVFTALQTWLSSSTPTATVDFAAVNGWESSEIFGLTVADFDVTDIVIL